VEIVGSATSQQFYYYFYDWHITREDRYCVGDLIPVVAVVMDSTSGIFNITTELLELMPNPATEEVTMRTEISTLRDMRVVLLDAQGSLVSGWEFDRSSGRILVRDMPQGLYLVRVEADGRTLIGRFIKM
jgi:hypothetical protein